MVRTRRAPPQVERRVSSSIAEERCERRVRCRAVLLPDRVYTAKACALCDAAVMRPLQLRGFVVQSSVSSDLDALNPVAPRSRSAEVAKYADPAN